MLCQLQTPVQGWMILIEFSSIIVGKKDYSFSLLLDISLLLNNARTQIIYTEMIVLKRYKQNAVRIRRKWYYFQWGGLRKASCKQGGIVNQTWTGPQPGL